MYDMPEMGQQCNLGITRRYFTIRFLETSTMCPAHVPSSAKVVCLSDFVSPSTNSDHKYSG